MRRLYTFAIDGVKAILVPVYAGSEEASMRLGVMSDTHGNLALMQRVADRMAEEFRVNAIVHLGDDYADAMSLKGGGARIIAVPGVYEAAWACGSVPHRLIEEFGGIRFLLSHTPTKDGHDFPGDIKPELAVAKHSCSVLLHGHTHRFRAVEGDGGLIIICPGHLKCDEDRGQPASFAVIDAEESDLKVDIYDAAGPLLDACSFVVAGASPPNR